MADTPWTWDWRLTFGWRFAFVGVCYSAGAEVVECPHSQLWQEESRVWQIGLLGVALILVASRAELIEERPPDDEGHEDPSRGPLLWPSKN